MRYEDRSAEAIPVVYGEDVRDYWNHDVKPVTRGKVVWRGSSIAARRSKRSLRLYLSMWNNPHPDKEVASIDYFSTMTSAASPFCVAMTVEKTPGDAER